MGKNIVLIGFMGTGKSSVGLRLAHKLKKEFVDIDQEIENVSGMSIAEMFKHHGETRFRAEESLMVNKLGEREDMIIATGGGVVLLKENIAALKKNGILVCLDASLEDIFERVNRKKGSRPLLKKNTQIEDISALLKVREPYYADAADIRVKTSNRKQDDIVNEIIREIGKH